MDHTEQRVKPSIPISKEEAKTINCYLLKFNDYHRLASVQYYFSGNASNYGDYGAFEMLRQYKPNQIIERYKNKKGEYLTCVISAREEPFLLGLGKVSSTASPIGKVFKSLPKTFELSDIKKNLPKNISGDILTVIAIADVLEHEKMAEKKSKHQRIAVYNKTGK